MEYSLAGRQEIVRDDPPVAAPPDRLGAHDRAAPLTAERPQPREAGAERLAQLIVGENVEALHAPERVDLGADVLRLAQAAERRHVLVADLERRERAGKRVAVILRVGA